MRRASFDGPFATMVGHCVRRLFASEEEQGGGTLGFGVGSILALLASPGAFASIFLMGKYSTLLEWMRGRHIDAISRSPSDEHFFIVLSMIVTGLVMVSRWNRLFPGKRDFDNLAPLPIPVRDIFLANFLALLGLAFLFGVDVNAVSSVLFPMFVTISYGTAAAFFRVAISHVTAVMGASLFSFFAVFALVGILMLITPRRLFRPVSLAVRIGLTVLLLAEFSSNILVQLFAGRLPGQAGQLMRWVPSYWFLGVYERMVGLAKPAMMQLGSTAGWALGVAVALCLVSYSLCYKRYFLRLAESFDALGATRYRQMTLPDGLAELIFRSNFERACSNLLVKTLLRSEPHLMFLGAYLGVGLVLGAQTAFDVTKQSANFPSADFLALPLLIAFFLVTGLRFAFDLPAALAANWIFRYAVTSQQPEPRKIARRAMLAAVVPWQILLVLPLTATSYGWRIGALHTAVLVSMTVLTVDGVLVGFRKIPFTCGIQLDVKQLVVRILATVFSVMFFVPMLAGVEGWTLRGSSVRTSCLLLLVWAGIYAVRRWREQDFESDRGIAFEDYPQPAFELLSLT